MVHLNTTAAYIRKSSTAAVVSVLSDNANRSLDRQVFELLSTPHTLDSLTRSVATETGSDEHMLEREVSSVLTRFLEDDLVELSPDS